MEFPIYTALTASIILILQLSLMLMVGFARLRNDIPLGEGGNQELLQAIRRHGNLAENAPIFLLVLGLGEMLAGSTTLVLALGVSFIVVRVAHAIGLTMGTGANAPRAIGAFGTLLAGVVVAVYVAYLALNLL